MKKILILSLLLSASPVALLGQTPPIRYVFGLQQINVAAAPQHITLVDADKTMLMEKPISNGILFTYKNRKADNVRITGDFSNWQPRAMQRSKHGIWYYFLPTMENGNGFVKYKFQVDGILIPDPSNTVAEIDGAGSFISLSPLPPEHYSNHITYRITETGDVEFRLYSPYARLISLVGDFNAWNPEHDLMQRGGDGVWRLTLRLLPGTYRYMYIVDGAASADVYNPKTASSVTGERCSLITVGR